jgi:hypothetical protein
MAIRGTRSSHQNVARGSPRQTMIQGFICFLLDEAKWLEGVSLNQVDREDWKIRLFSKILGEPVWIVSSQVDVSDLPEGEVIYTIPECQILVDRLPTPDELTAIHLTKKYLDGEIEGEDQMMTSETNNFLLHKN